MTNWKEISRELFKKKPEGVPRKQKLIRIIQEYKTTKDPLLKELGMYLGSPMNWDYQSIDTVYEYITEPKPGPALKIAAKKEARDPLRRQKVEQLYRLFLDISMQGGRFDSEFAKSANPSNKSDAEIDQIWNGLQQLKPNMEATIAELKKSISNKTK